MSTVIVASGVANKSKKYENVTARTWAELKPIISEMITPDTEVILSPGNLSLKLDSAALPEGDYRILIIPTKNKAGMTPEQAKSVADEISKAIIAAAAKVSKDETDNLKAEIIGTIEDFFNVSLDEEPDCTGCAEALAEAKSLSN